MKLNILRHVFPDTLKILNHNNSISTYIETKLNLRCDL